MGIDERRREDGTNGQTVGWAAECTQLLRQAIPAIDELHTTLTPVHWRNGTAGWTFVATFTLVGDACVYAVAVNYPGPLPNAAEDAAGWAAKIAAGIGGGFGHGQRFDLRVVD